MRISGCRIRHRIFDNLAGLWIQFPDISLVICCEPNVAFFIGDQSVRTGIPILDLVFLNLAGVDIQTPDDVRILTGVPKRTVWTDFRIVRVGVWRRSVPLFDGDADVVCRERYRREKKKRREAPEKHLLMAAPFLEAARYRACASLRVCIRSAHGSLLVATF